MTDIAGTTFVVSFSVKLEALIVTEPATGDSVSSGTPLYLASDTSDTPTAYYLTDNTNVYTIWVKVLTDTTEKPAVSITKDSTTLGSSNGIAATVNKLDGNTYNGYYCVQIINNSDTQGTTVTFSVAGAEKSVTLPTSTGTE